MGGHVAQQAEQLLRELAEHSQLNAEHIVVIGTSTSEVAGERIGSAGSAEIASEIFKGLSAVSQSYGFALAFQCCEHLNRALVVERSVMQRHGLQEVTAIPVAEAGGAMAAYAYQHFNEPCLVEHIQADAGIDIGSTLIGMHLRPVAVPYRATIDRIGEAYTIAAFTRPKLIGGARAVYETT